ncbi:glycosyltransferase family 2 protein [Vibrio mimicus]|uniref:glycosyltransferase family 2 protein n=1 Tax=Vibrio mimicus TaxID=674 RepID=UPI0011D8C325|nr:glycosyltransferase family 2 protein [Vibrio mimicus]TXX99431.1 glycosyltransferase family 2 protein [Vibrio mimicus]
MIKLRIIIPCYNEGENINRSAKKLGENLDILISKGLVSPSSDILFVDDGSKDDTWNRIICLKDEFDYINGLKLSINKGHQIALKAGLDYSVDQCDFSISIDADLQQDPSKIEEFILEYNKGIDVVYGVRRDRKTDGLIKLMTAKTFYKVAGHFGIKLIQGHADYRGLSNKALKILKQYDSKNPFLRGIIPSLGLPSAIVEFEVFEREIGSSKYTLSKMMNLALSGIINFSIVPIRLFAAFGLLIVLGCCAMFLYVLYATLIMGGSVPGWASTTLPIYLLGGVQLVGLSVIGEYVGKIFIEVNKSPTYIVDETTK